MCVIHTYRTDDRYGHYDRGGRDEYAGGGPPRSRGYGGRDRYGSRDDRYCSFKMCVHTLHMHSVTAVTREHCNNCRYDGYERRGGRRDDYDRRDDEHFGGSRDDRSLVIIIKGV